MFKRMVDTVKGWGLAIGVGLVTFVAVRALKKEMKNAPPELQMTLDEEKELKLMFKDLIEVANRRDKLPPVDWDRMRQEKSNDDI